MASTTSRRHRMRCSRGPKSGCGKRFTLRKHPDQYVRAIKCPHCGSTRVLSDEKYRRAEQLRHDECCCYAYPFKHERGTLRMCEHHPKAGIEPTDDEIRAYELCIETPRSA